MKNEPVQQVYAHPDTYDLEHAVAEPDVEFFIRLATEQKASRILEIACGNGRVTIPLARAAREWGGAVVGLELAQEMLDSARSKPDAGLVEWRQGDVRDWRSDEPFDLILSPCASMSHLLTLEDQLAAWRTAHSNLSPGGCFVVAEQMANLPALAESMQIPPRAALEIDADRSEPGDPERRMLRYRATRYHAHDQRATVHFLYEQFSGDEVRQRSLSDYASHVFFPRELQLLFVATGFSVEKVWGDYRSGSLRHESRQIIVSGRK